MKMIEIPVLEEYSDFTSLKVGDEVDAFGDLLIYLESFERNKLILHGLYLSEDSARALANHILAILPPKDADSYR